MSYKSSLYENRTGAVETMQSPPILFVNLQTPSHLKRLADIVLKHKLWGDNSYLKKGVRGYLETM